MADSTERVIYCTRCGLPSTFGTKMIQVEQDKFLCESCVEELYGKVQRSKEIRSNSVHTGAKGKHKETPSSIKRYLDDYIIDQDKAKKIISVAIYNHYKMVSMKKRAEEAGVEPPEIEKSNVFLIGPSGSGKTAMIKRIAKKLKVPFAISDATSLTSAGYVGKDVETMLRDLIINADNNIEAAQYGIIYIDEIDKISRKGENTSTTADPGHEGVQQALLKLVEGNIIDVPQKGQRNHPQAPTVKIDTSNILFIVGGAFEGIEKIIAKRQRKAVSSVGFGSQLVKHDDKKYNDFILSVQSEDLRKYGLMSEFIGRIPIICPLQELSEGALIKILTEPKNSLLKQYQALFNDDGVDLSFTEDALKLVAKRAIERKTGARSLRTIMEAILNPIEFDLPDQLDIDAVEVDANEDGTDFIVNKKKENMEGMNYVTD